MKGDVTLTFLPLSFWGVKKNITKKFKVTFRCLITCNGENHKCPFSNNKICTKLIKNRV